MVHPLAPVVLARAVKRWSGWDARDSNSVAVARTMAVRCVTVHLRLVGLAISRERRESWHGKAEARMCVRLFRREPCRLACLRC